MSSTREKATARAAGFTLVELMIAVTIVSILSAIAVPMFSSYVGKSRTVEASGFLQEVKARQESYRFDFGMYCNVSTGGRGDYYPKEDPSSRLLRWEVNGPWAVLGANPSGFESRFVYSTVASGPGSVDPLGKMPSAMGFSGTDADRGYPSGASGPTDFWFITTAVGDLNGDCTGTGDDASSGGKKCNMVFESYSHTRGIYSSVGDSFE